MYNWHPLIYTLLFQQYTVQKKETASTRSWFALLLLLCFAPMVLSLKLTGWLACQKQSSWQKNTFLFQMCTLLHFVIKALFFSSKWNIEYFVNWLLEWKLFGVPVNMSCHWPTFLPCWHGRAVINKPFLRRHNQDWQAYDICFSVR